MTDAQKALDELPIPFHIRLGFGASSGTIVHWYDEHEKTIHRALRLLAAVEAGEWKVVPANLLGCQVNAMAAQEFTTDNGNSSYVDLYRVALQAAPDFFAEDGK